MAEAIRVLVVRLINEALARPAVELVGEFALPLQSRALTHLLNVPGEEADIWIGWGTHVFKSADGSFKSGNVLESYLEQRFDEAISKPPGSDFFSALAHTEFRGRRLQKSEMIGFANLAFAGGRDTVIHIVTSSLFHLAKNPGIIDWLRENTSRATHAAEEFFRVFMPLTHIGRTETSERNIHGVDIHAGQRVSLCWASANLDESVFPAPRETRLDRKPNPHVSFGFGEHLCLGAPHARLILRTLLREIANGVSSIEILEEKKRLEIEEGYTREVGFESLTAGFCARVDRSSAAGNNAR